MEKERIRDDEAEQRGASYWFQKMTLATNFAIGSVQELVVR